MGDEGRGEDAGEAKVAPPTSDSEVEIPVSEIELLEDAYETSEGDPWREFPWIDGEALYSSFYRDQLNETVKDEFFKVEVSDLDHFCGRHGQDASWLRDMLADAVMFFKLHNTWQVYICPSCECLRWFPDDDSLALHLMYEHCNALPFLRHNPTKQQWCAEALRSTVWKPIDARVALNTLSKIDSSLDTDHLGSLEWPLSEDCRRSELLAQLQKGFELLLDSGEGDSFTVCSGGCLRALIAVASEHILRHLDPMNILPLPSRALLYYSPLSFCFMEEDSLGHFVSLVEAICKATQASQNRELEGGKDDDVSWSKSECPDAVSFSADSDYFVLDGAKLNFCGADENNMSVWLFKAPYFPTIEKLPTKASEILQLAEKKAVSFSECLRTVHAQSDLKLLTSCLKILNMGHWPMPLLDTSSPELASNSESNAANVEDMLAPCYSFGEAAKQQRTEFDSQHYLKLIKLAWELQFLELQVRRLCAVDLRDYILPLLKSFLRMKFYLCIRIETVFVPDVKEEDADEGNYITEWSVEEHHEEHVLSKFEGEPAAGDGSIMMMPDMSSYKRSEGVSTTPPELRSSGSSAISVSDLDPMMIDGGEALEGEPPGASAGCTDNSASQVASADAALSGSKTGIAAAIAESEAKPEAMPESDAEPELKAEPESQRSQDVQVPLCRVLDMFPDSDRLYQSRVRFIDGVELNGFPEEKFFEMKEFSTVVWLMREKCAWENKDDGLFVCITINDVMKHCLEKKFGLETAQNIWGWKTSRTRKYWRCFECNKKFPHQKSHMLHLGLSLDNDWLVPIQVQQEGQSGVNEGVKERTHSLDDSITVDCTYRRFVVEMAKFGSSYQNEEEGQVKNVSQLGQIFCHCRVLEEICSLGDTCTKSKLCLTSEVGEEDAEIVQKFAELKMSKQYLSNLCLSDYKNEIVPSIRSFMQKHMDSVFRSWALERLDELLGDVRCPGLGLPDSFSIKLASPGKVIINIEEYDARITFAYLGICWKFAGDVPFKQSQKIEGIFMFSGITNSYNYFHHHSNLILDNEIKTTMKMFFFRGALERKLERDVRDKLRQFQAECRRKLRKVK